jgi:hypothetical protein
VSQPKPIDGEKSSVEPRLEPPMPEEEREDYLDYCAAAEAIDEALEKGGIKRTKDFAKELGFDF